MKEFDTKKLKFPVRPNNRKRFRIRRLQMRMQTRFRIPVRRSNNVLRRSINGRRVHKFGRQQQDEIQYVQMSIGGRREHKF